ncbi:MAG: cytochrome c maturation protein CcmE [Anaerolineales bacterium]|nr:cytochrome c maturation protein CcmE [Anaerolineales bacterium]
MKTRKKELLIGGVVIAAALVFLIVNATRSNTQYFKTVEEVLALQNTSGGHTYRVSGAVIGESILYDTDTETLQFTIAHVPASMDEVEKQGGLASVLQQAVQNPDSPRLDVLYKGPMPDLMRNEAQAIVTGRIGEDGVFVAEELLLKCPSKYDSELPAGG